jgi:glycosyltransferase involved in cell wall biosynthesis
MIDFTNTQTRQRLIHQFKGLYPLSFPLKILIVTYNRLAYLKKCIASIHGSTAVPYQIMVADDGSTDGTVEWLLSQRKRKKIEYLVFNQRIGTAENFNTGIKYCNSEFVVMTNDDVYFHRWWDFASLHVINTELEAASLTIYDYTNNKGILERKGDYDLFTGSGLAAAFIRTTSWAQAGEFRLPKKQLMGSFAMNFCTGITKFADHNQHFITRPNWASHMDFPTSDLSERDVLGEYVKYRQKEKRIKQ